MKMTWKCRKGNRNVRIKWLYIIILIMIPTVLFILQRSGGNLAGTKVDWISQHAVFPEYFRQLFYKTGNLFPQFAGEIGGGQNIYNYAYYGLCNPLYWISYLFPTVKMTNYLQAVSLLGEIAGGLLCYLWLGSHFGKKHGFLGAMVLVMALPLTYHASSQVMFVNYMPFLIAALIGYDRYNRTSRYRIMIISIVMMILISFYFAVGGLAALILYAISGWKKEQASSVSVFIKHVWYQFYPVLLGGFLAMFYLIPVYCAMRQNRNGSAGVNVRELLVPDVSMQKFLYSPYGLGVAAMVVVAVCTSLFYKKGQEKWLGILLSVVIVLPVFSWILNGGLYIRDKALIPMLPLICFLFAGFTRKLEQKKLRGMQVGAGYLLAVAVLLAGSREVSALVRYTLWAELAVCGTALLICLKLWKHAVRLTAAAAMAAACLVQISVMQPLLVSEDFAGELDNKEVVQAIEQVLGEDNALFRTEVRGDAEYNKANQNRVLSAGQSLTTSYSSINNAGYHTFRSKLGLNRPTRNSLMEDTVDNPLFLRFMGVKYLVGEVHIAGYERRSMGDSMVYVHENVAPLFYLTNQTISEEQFGKLTWAQKQLSLLQDVAAGSLDGDVSTQIEPVDVMFSEQRFETGAIKWTGETLKVHSDGTVRETIPLSREAGPGEYLFLSFSIENRNKNKDVSITVNGQKNKLSGANRVYYNDNDTFHYTCAILAGMKEITVQFGAGHYNISNIRGWFGSINEERNTDLYQDSIDLSRMRTGDGFVGRMDASEDCWMITSIPYDENFQIYVDDKLVGKQKVNTAFLGAKIAKGSHKLRIVYAAPGWKTGMAVTGITCVLLAADYVRKRRNRYENKAVKI